MAGPQDWAALLAIVTTLGGLAMAFHFRVVRPAQRQFQQLLELIPSVNLLKAELSTNGGLSIKDKINAIDQTVRVLTLHARVEQEHSEQCLFECDAEGRTTYVNGALASLLGLSRDEVLGNGWLKAIPVEDRVEQWELWLNSIRSGVPYDATYDVQPPGRSEKFMVRATASVILGGNGRVLGYYGVVRRLSKTSCA